MRNAMAASYPVRNEPNQSRNEYGPTGIVDWVAFGGGN
jgi:hypothetical protein